MSSVSAFGNGLAPKSALVFVEGMWLTPDMARRIIYSFARIRARGATIRGNQGYRWKGVASDRRIGALGLGEELTSDGTGNQFYQKGREDAGLTPSAATPGFSNHGGGNSVDTDCSSLAIRDEEFAKVGLRRDIASETWHATIFRDPSVDLSSINIASDSTTPFEEDDMTPQQAQSLADVQKDIVAILGIVSNLVEAVWARPVDRLDKDGNIQRVASLQELADVKSMLLEVKPNVEKITRKLGAENS